MTTPSFATSLDALGGWRAALGERLDALARFLGEHELGLDATAEQVASLRERLGNEKLVVAFVAEFSRGKSELINAIFFADTGRRILPATPGRTTMCPVELGWRGGEPPSLLLLPIETRLEGLSLGELRTQPRAWRRLELDVGDSNQLAESLLEVTRTEWVTLEQARALGFWDDQHPDDNPPRDETGRVEVPAWRHALINYPHPLLKQGLVVLDTPGLNAIGAEPELTLSLLPSAHATVFILGADTGVTKSDMAIWRDHLGVQTPTRFVVLNKIDALEDPLAAAGQVEAQIVMQQRDTARMLGVAAARVFPISARQALAARVAGDDAALAQSRLPELEAALGAQLLPQRRHVLEQVVQESAQQIENHVGRHIGDARRQLAEQTLELRG
ncbi:MAG: dynamin family protein, partial [Caldimonas sp.]